jgi:peptidoglycan hydrolase-like protein with peptidoglycan-binding domain
MNLSYGATGSDVRKLQEALNKSGGYGLAVDGIYGDKTQSAVNDYQTKNNLKISGGADQDTLNMLYGTGGSTGVATQNQAQSTAAQPAKPAGYYQPSESVEAYKQQLQAAMGNKPGGYQSQYESQMNELMAQINGRQPFQYSPEADALYQQYKEQYANLGRKAMMDTMGQAAGLTGGYGSTYSQNVGQQAYGEYMQGLMEQIPALAEAAHSRYRQEGQDMQDRYAMMAAVENQDYSRYRDQMSDWGDEVSRLYSLYSGERDFERADLSENRQYAYDTAMSMISAGLMPSEQMLADAGISAADAQKIVEAYQLQQRVGGGPWTEEPDTETPIDDIEAIPYRKLVPVVGEAVRNGKTEAALAKELVESARASGEINDAQYQSIMNKYFPEMW